MNQEKDRVIVAVASDAVPLWDTGNVHAWLRSAITLQVGDILELEESGEQWRLESYSMIGSAEDWAAGLRTVVLRPIGHPKPLREGMQLIRARTGCSVD